MLNFLLVSGWLPAHPDSPGCLLSSAQPAQLSQLSFPHDSPSACSAQLSQLSSASSASPSSAQPAQLSQLSSASSAQPAQPASGGRRCGGRFKGPFQVFILGRQFSCRNKFGQIRQVCKTNSASFPETNLQNLLYEHGEFGKFSAEQNLLNLSSNVTLYLVQVDFHT